MHRRSCSRGLARCAARFGPGNPTRVPDGLIHHWVGAKFIPGAHIDDIVAIVSDYDRPPYLGLRQRAFPRSAIDDILSVD
ncbi:MAG: hypothetical protein ABSB35_13825 [Bryobacteraceae bacterium]|jgi:hypothetical protein